MTERDDLAEQGLPAEAAEAAEGIDPETQEILDQLGTDEPDSEPAPRRAPTPRRPSSSRRKKPASTASSSSGGGGSSAPKRPTSRASKPPSSRVNIKSQMAQLYTMAGVGVSMAGTMRQVPPNPQSGVVVTAAIGEAMVAQAEACGAAWEQLARDNPRVKRALEQLLSVSAVGVLIGAHVPIIMAGIAASGGVGGVAAIPPAPESEQPATASGPVGGVGHLSPVPSPFPASY